MPNHPLDQQIDILSKDVEKPQKPLATSSNLPAGQIVTSLIGSWGWTNDIQNFSSDGKGTYWREGKICYTFTYSVRNNKLHIVADYEHSCGGEDESYLIEFNGDNLKLRHIGSGFTTQWRKVP